MNKLYRKQHRIARLVAGAWIGLLIAPLALADRNRAATPPRTVTNDVVVSSRTVTVVPFIARNVTRNGVSGDVVIESTGTGGVIVRRGDTILVGDATMTGGILTTSRVTVSGAETADVVTPPTTNGDVINSDIVTSTTNTLNTTNTVTSGPTTIIDPFVGATNSPSTLVQSTLTGPFNQSTTPSAVLMNGIAPVGTVTVQTVPLGPTLAGDAIQTDIVTSPVTPFNAAALTVGAIPNLPAGSTPSLPVGAIPHLPAGSTLPVAVGAPIGTIVVTPGSPTVIVNPVFVNGTTTTATTTATTPSGTTTAGTTTSTGSMTTANAGVRP